jgi:hypothetical protein
MQRKFTSGTTAVRNGPHAIRIEHHKTGAPVWHPLEEEVDGESIKFYAGAEIAGSEAGWLGREDSNLRMAESKSAWKSICSGPHFEKYLQNRA